MSTIRVFLTILAILLIGGPAFGGITSDSGAGTMAVKHAGMDGCCGNTSPAPECGMVGAHCGAACMTTSAARHAVAEYRTVLAAAPLSPSPRSYLPAPETAPPKPLSA
ncbi:MAG: hypothetical protein ABI654_01255 [Betaproteobacteria bacterium]